ncbi:MAG: prepilin-type N-terminal cleavage/methylation domain-containing protein [Clostridia bacterium]|nr:prepilin-type N-terminal cleavage/methylation domain-containing protein [Clostridia bacterium]
MKNQKGFTLVELMVVVAILGVLVAIAIPVYNNVTNNAKIAACKASVRTINGAIEVYHAATGSYPTDIATDLVPGYLKELPVCPFGTAYTIVSNSVAYHTH